MRMGTMATLVALATVLSTSARAHDRGREDDAPARYRATLVDDADAGDLSLGSADGGFVTIDGEDGGEVKLSLAGVVDGTGARATAQGCQLTVTGAVAGVPATKTFAFDLTEGRAKMEGSLGLLAGDRFEVAGAAVACPPAGVFAVPGLAAGEHDDEDHGDGGHGDRDDDDGDDDDDDDGDDDRDHGHGGRGHHGDHVVVAAHRHGHGRGHDHHDGRHGDRDDADGGIRSPLIADADAGDYGVDSASGSFVEIEQEDGGKVKLRIAGVTDAAGAPVTHAGNRLVVTGLRNGAAFTAAFPFDLEGGKGRVRGTLGLGEGDVLEVQSIVVDDGASVFAVPGILVREDDDDDGVPDGDDDCDESGSPAVGDDGCSLSQQCPCDADRRALRACIKNAARGIKARMRASCGKGKRCRQLVRQLHAERRSLLKSCRR